MKVYKFPHIKNISALLLAFIMVFTLLPLPVNAAETVTEITMNEINFPDVNFREYIKQFDKDSSGSLSENELGQVTQLHMWAVGISDLTGIEYFTSVTYLDCSSNELTSLDISKNTALITLDCSNNPLTSLDTSKNTLLKNLYCSNNPLTSLDTSKNTLLKNLYCSNNPLTSLDTSKNTLLKNLYCNFTHITDLDVSNNTNLTSFYFSHQADIVLETDYTYDLNNLPYFNLDKAFSFDGFILDGTTITVPDLCRDYVSFKIDCGNNHYGEYRLYIDHVHDPELISGKASTCENYGSKEYYQCTYCGKYYEDKNGKKPIAKDIREWKKIPKKEHSLDEGMITKATPFQNGVIIKKCKNCDYQENEVISYPATITLSSDSYTYNGRTKKPSISVTDSLGKAVTASNYDVTYEKGCKNVGTYDVTITFKGDCYTGDTVKTFTINPKNTGLKKLSAGKKSITVKWKKLTKRMKKSRISGYQIQYSTSSKFKKAKIKKVKGYKASSFKLTKLKAKKKYYVRVRTYMTVNKKTYYSSWSKTKTVKTK